MAERPRARERPARAGLTESWRRLGFEQRVAAIGAVLLVVSTFGPFSFVEAALVLVAGAVLYLLKQRADGRAFHLPFGDGTIIFAAGIWSALLIVVRLFDRPLGQGLLALVCAAILILAGARARSKRPPDDLPPDVRPGPPLTSRRGPVTRHGRRPRAGTVPATPAGAQAAGEEFPAEPLAGAAPQTRTERLPGAESVPEPEGPPEFEPPGREAPKDAEQPPTGPASPVPGATEAPGDARDPHEQRGDRP